MNTRSAKALAAASSLVAAGLLTPKAHDEFVDAVGKHSTPTPSQVERYRIQGENEAARVMHQSACVAHNVKVNTRQVRRDYARTMAKRGIS